MPPLSAPATPDFPIDVVITWVDGGDPKHNAKRAEHTKASPRTLPGTESTRFASVDEVIYCTLSILKFAPFVRRIFIVTDDQIPPVFDAVRLQFPDQINKIEIVDHKVIFRGHEHVLPTFNSRSIETMLPFIPNLSEHFIFFNDDFFLINHVTPKDFFDGDQILVEARWQSIKPYPHKVFFTFVKNLLRMPVKTRRIYSKTAQQKAAILAGFEHQFMRTNHTPLAWRKSTLAEYFSAHPGLLENNNSYRFRDGDQFLACTLSQHLDYKSGKAKMVKTRRGVYSNANETDLTAARKVIDGLEANSDARFFCLQSLDQAENDVQAVYLDYLKAVTAAV